MSLLDAKPQLKWLILALIACLLVGCARQTSAGELHLHEDGTTHLHEDGVHGHASMTLTLPELSRANADGPLNVVATTSLIGDTIEQVAGDAVALTVLVPPDADPHDYQLTEADVAVLYSADVVFVNGWGLEQAMTDALQAASDNVPIVAISAYITPMEVGEHSHDAATEADEDHEHTFEGVDPHVWMDVRSVEIWAVNAADMLSLLDPNNAELYQQNALAYSEELQTLHSEINERVRDLPLADRVVISGNDGLRYLGLAYGFDVQGPVSALLATPSAESADPLLQVAQLMDERHMCLVFEEPAEQATMLEALSQASSGCPASLDPQFGRGIDLGRDLR